MNELPIDRVILHFLEKIVSHEAIDLIVCSERKGTAVLRALIQEMGQPRLEWEWDKVVSTAALEEFDWSRFSGKRVLFFDELVHHGRSLKRAKERLFKLVRPGVDIKTAGFAVWDGCVHHPDFSYYPAVDLEQYVDIRNQIIKMLQGYGSLLLDTEHLEITARLDCGLKEFYQELARAADKGNTFSFLSASERLNLTIWNPEIIEPDELNKWLIPGSNTKGVVSKCRVLEKDHSQFSIMPILYPNTRCVVDRKWVDALPSFIDRNGLLTARAEYLFYIVGLMSSIEVLKGVVSALSELIKKNRIVLEVPQHDFTHLKAMFPLIDTDQLWEYVKGVVNESKLHKPRRSSRGVEVHSVPAAKLLNMSYFLITHLVERLDEQSTDMDDRRGVPWFELDRIATAGEEFIDVDHRWWSIVPDRLIDSGLMHTHVSQIQSSKGEPWAVRMFGPDSEVVTEKLRRQTAVRGSSWLPTT